METRARGAFGEERAVRFLRRKGYRIVERNFRCRQGEIDVIAADRRFVAFVEVKLRQDDSFAKAREFVTRAKQARIIAAAQEWLQPNPTNLQPRFDVAEIYAPQGTQTPDPVFRYWENAFSAD